MRASILDQSPVIEDSTPEQALRNTVDLATRWFHLLAVTGHDLVVG